MITLDELTKRFKGVCDLNKINELFTEADIDKDGKISKEDFMKMMQQFIENCD